MEARKTRGKGGKVVKVPAALAATVEAQAVVEKTPDGKESRHLQLMEIAAGEYSTFTGPAVPDRLRKVKLIAKPSLRLKLDELPAVGAGWVHFDEDEGQILLVLTNDAPAPKPPKPEKAPRVRKPKAEKAEAQSATVPVNAPTEEKKEPEVPVGAVVQEAEAALKADQG